MYDNPTPTSVLYDTTRPKKLTWRVRAQGQFCVEPIIALYDGDIYLPYQRQEVEQYIEQGSDHTYETPLTQSATRAEVMWTTCEGNQRYKAIFSLPE